MPMAAKMFRQRMNAGCRVAVATVSWVHQRIHELESQLSEFGQLRHLSH